MEKCNFCQQEKEGVKVFATDYAPVSLSYCPDCSKVSNIRPREIALYGWGRLGEGYLTPRIWPGEDVEYPPMVYSEGEYITVKELIDNLTEEQIHEWVKPAWSFRLPTILKRFNEEKNG